MTNKSILFAFSGRHIGGAELVTTEAVRTAIGAGYKVSAICNSKEVAGLLSNLDIQVKTVDFPKLCGKTEMLTALYRAIYFYYFILKTGAMTVVCEGKIFSQVFGIIRRVSKFKFINYVHFPISSWDYSATLISMSDLVITCSDSIKTQIKSYDHQDKLKIEVLPNFSRIVGSDIAANDSDSNPLFELLDTTLNIICVGHLSEVKNQKLLIEILSAIRKNFPELKIQLLLLGKDNCSEGKNLASLQEQTRHYAVEDCVHFIGVVKDPTPYYRRSHIFALPSLKEGMPLVLLEAMSLGLACIVTPVDGNIEVIVDNRNGLLRDLESFQAGMESLVADSDLRERLGKAALLDTQTKFSRSKYQERFLGFLSL